MLGPIQRSDWLGLTVLAAVVVASLGWSMSRTEPAEELAPPVGDQPNFAVIDKVSEKKERFFGFLRPLVEGQNERVRRTRERIQKLRGHWREAGALGADDRSWLRELAERYRLGDGQLSERFFERLLTRVDVLPPSLVLAQAANESAWGTSRFARQGRNYFGQWCFKKGCGLVPHRRSAGASHEVATFDSVAASVRAYFINLNSHPAYAELRRIRAQLRERNEPISGARLSEGLEKYSERGKAYVDELQAMIRVNRLGRLDAGVAKSG